MDSELVTLYLMFCFFLIKLELNYPVARNNYKVIIISVQSFIHRKSNFCTTQKQYKTNQDRHAKTLLTTCRGWRSNSNVAVTVRWSLKQNKALYSFGFVFCEILKKNKKQNWTLISTWANWPKGGVTSDIVIIALSGADSGMNTAARCSATALSLCKYLFFYSWFYHLAGTMFSSIIVTVFPGRLPIGCQPNTDVE